MSNPTDPSSTPTDALAPTEPLMQPVQPAPTTDALTGLPIGDDSVSGPVIINR